MEYADRVLRETMKHSTISSEAISITDKRTKERKEIYEGQIYIPGDLPPYQINLTQYDNLIKEPNYERRNS